MSAVAANAVEERFCLLELAERNACFERTVSAAAFTRFAPLCSCRGAVWIKLRFHFNEAGHIEMDGKVATRLAVECHRCLDSVEVDLESAFFLVVVKSDEQARRLGPRFPVLLVQGDLATLQELVEDELILALPERPCTDQACPKAFARACPETVLAPVENPFQALGPWRRSSGNL